MRRIRLIHWKEEELPGREELLRNLGYEVIAGGFSSPEARELRENSPDAVVIDLSRLPGRGTDCGIYLRSRKTTRLIPIIYVEGAPDKVAKVKTIIPDARYTTYSKIGPVLEDVLANPPREAFVYKSGLAPAPLPKKLGVKEDQPAGLINAPAGFEALIPGIEWKRDPKVKVPLTLWFVETRKQLEADIPKIRKRAEDSGIWIVWPKQTKSAKPDINSNLVRQLALAAGLVDFKICAVDEKWSAMRFAVKR